MMKNAGFKVVWKGYYFNLLFAFHNFANFNSIFTNFLIWSNKKFRWGWRGIAIGKR